MESKLNQTSVSSLRSTAMRRLRAALSVPLMSQWRMRRTPELDSTMLAAPSDSTLSFFTIDEDEPRGEVTLYPIYIDSEYIGDSATKESSEPLESLSLSKSTTSPLQPSLAMVTEIESSAATKTLAKDRTDENKITLPDVSYEEQNMKIKTHPKITRTFWELLGNAVEIDTNWIFGLTVDKILGATQRWLFTYVCSRRIRLAFIGILSVVWGILQCAMWTCALLFIILGNLDSIIKDVGLIDGWSDASAITLVAFLLALHVAQVFSGSLLVSASKVSGYPSQRQNPSRIEELLLNFLKMLNVHLQTAPPTLGEHMQPPTSKSNSSSTSSSTSSTSSTIFSSNLSSKSSSNSNSFPTYEASSSSSGADYVGLKRITHCQPPSILDQSNRAPTFLKSQFLPNSNHSPQMGWVQLEEQPNENEDQNWPESNSWPTPNFSQNCTSSFSSSSSNIVSKHGISDIKHSVPKNLSGQVPNNTSLSLFDLKMPGNVQEEDVPGPMKVGILKTTVPETQKSSGAPHNDVDGWMNSCRTRDLHLLLPWLYTSLVTLATILVLVVELGINGWVATAVGVCIFEVPALACIIDVFAEIRGVPEIITSKESHLAPKEEEESKRNKTGSSRNVHFALESPIRNVDPPASETSPLLF